MRYGNFTKSEFRNSTILRFCARSRKTAVEVADKIDLSLAYTKKILRELIEYDKLYKHTTKAGEFYRTAGWIRLEIEEMSK